MIFNCTITYSQTESSFYEPIYGNYKFDTDLNDFGIMKERKFRKTNKLQSILKLKESKSLKSIYPILDEFGYSFMDFFIFKSTWDLKYHIETTFNKEEELSFELDNKRYLDDINNTERFIKDWEYENDMEFGRRVIKKIN